jgi:hypothetical protein
MRMPKVGDKVVCIDDESFGTVVYLTAGGSPEIKFDDGSHGTYMLREFAELFGYTTLPAQEFVCSTGLCHYKPAAPTQPAPEQYTALEQALTRLQKRYGELEAKAAVMLRCWLTDEQKLDVVADYFDHVDGDWAVKKASQLLDAYESKLKELNA